MATTDSNGIIFLEDTDNIAPFHTLINMLQTGTSGAFTNLANVAGAVRTTFTPTITGPTINYGTGAVRTGRYRKTGREVVGTVTLVFGTGMTVTGDQDWFFPLPVSPVGGTALVIGSAWMATAVGTNYIGAVSTSGTSAVIRPHGTLFTTNRVRPFTWAAGDSLLFEFAYESLT